MDVKQLEKIMIEHGLVIRGIPFIKKSILEKKHKDRFPEGKIIFLEKYGREMLVIEEKNTKGGKFVVEQIKSQDSLVRFSSKRFFDTIEDAKNHILEKSDY